MIGRVAAVHAAVGAVIAARRADLGVHIVEIGPGEYDVVLRIEGPFRNHHDARRSAGFLRDTLSRLMPGPELGWRNPRDWLIRPPTPVRHRNHSRRRHHDRPRFSGRR